MLGAVLCRAFWKGHAPHLLIGLHQTDLRVGRRQEETGACAVGSGRSPWPRVAERVVTARRVGRARQGVAELSDWVI